MKDGYIITIYKKQRTIYKMRINRIALYNFGPYEGLNEFDIEKQTNTGNIVLIGGKNGAGKTTLFSAIRLSLYGYRESGYQSANSYYIRKVKKLINDKAKREERVESYVEVEFSIVHGSETDIYIVKRSWNIENNETSENMFVVKNGVQLYGDDINDFENYMLNVLPPELFDLYFFDGEKITDFFMEDGSNSRIKNAFLILCGYDNFEIMYRNFKRIGIGNKTNGEVIKRYTEARDKLAQATKIYEKINCEIEEKKQEIVSVKSEIEELERRYRDKGGVTMEEWNNNFLKLKKEEQFREQRNEWIKKAANDIIPFLILRDKIEALVNTLEKEEANYEIEALKKMCVQILQEAARNLVATKSVDTSVIKALLNESESIISSAGTEKIILGLSLEEKKLLSGQLYSLRQLEKKSVLDNRMEVKESIERSKAIRSIIENSSVHAVQEYFEKKEELLQLQAKLSDDFSSLIEYIKNVEIDLEIQRETYNREKRALEEELKKNSVSNMTSKAILLLESLQEKLFSTEISKVESFFMEKIKELARKTSFIDAIRIDEDFNVHIFKKVKLPSDELYQAIARYDEESYIKEFGKYHWNFLLQRFTAKDRKDLMRKIKSTRQDVDINYEIDKAVLSNGEKQVYIMTLYWSIMKLCRQEVPFIIDTPFARIDSEHRANITDKFFNDLAGQVFIFSTNEEIVGKHLEIIKENIQATFLLENTENEKTTVCTNSYFGG